MRRTMVEVTVYQDKMVIPKDAYDKVRLEDAFLGQNLIRDPFGKICLTGDRRQLWEAIVTLADEYDIVGVV